MCSTTRTIYHGDRDVDAAAKPATCVYELMTQPSLTLGSIFINGFTKLFNPRLQRGLL